MANPFSGSNPFASTNPFGEANPFSSPPAPVAPADAPAYNYTAGMQQMNLGPTATAGHPPNPFAGMVQPVTVATPPPPASYAPVVTTTPFDPFAPTQSAAISSAGFSGPDPFASLDLGLKPSKPPAPAATPVPAAATPVAAAPVGFDDFAAFPQQAAPAAPVAPPPYHSPPAPAHQDWGFSAAPAVAPAANPWQQPPPAQAPAVAPPSFPASSWYAQPAATGSPQPAAAVAPGAWSPAPVAQPAAPVPGAFASQAEWGFDAFAQPAPAAAPAAPPAAAPVATGFGFDDDPFGLSTLGKPPAPPAAAQPPAAPAAAVAAVEFDDDIFGLGAPKPPPPPAPAAAPVEAAPAAAAPPPPAAAAADATAAAPNSGTAQDPDFKNPYPPAGNKLRVTLMARAKRPKNEDITYKFDGKRFGVSEVTVKLKAEAEYEFIVCFNPAAFIRKAAVAARDPQKEFQPDFLTPAETKSATTMSGRNEWQMDWHCRLPTSKTQHRLLVRLEMDVVDFGKIAMPMLVKVYHPDDPSAAHGVPLRALTMTYEKSADTGKITIANENYT